MGSHMLYAVTMRDAIASNDLAQMKAVAEQAKKSIKEQGDMSQALVELYAAIKKIEG